MSTTYTVVVDESSNDIAALTENHYNLAVAKAVSKGGNTIVNTIFQSSSHASDEKPGRTTTVSWIEYYGMNYSQQLPTPGAKVVVGGAWQAFNLGDHYMIDTNGNWKSANAITAKREAYSHMERPKKPNFAVTDPSTALNVTNQYQPVHMIVGVQDPTSGDYNPIFFDPDQLLMNATGSYQPLELINLWWGEEQDNGTVISDQQTPVEAFTLKDANPIYFHYDVDQGLWQEQTTAFNLK